MYPESNMIHIPEELSLFPHIWGEVWAFWGYNQHSELFMGIKFSSFDGILLSRPDKSITVHLFNPIDYNIRCNHRAKLLLSGNIEHTTLGH